MGISHEVSFFKAYQGKGAAARFEYRKTQRGPAIFLSMAKEIGEKKFDWDNKVIFSVGQGDMAAIMMVLQNRKDGCGKQKDGSWSGLYHENDKGNSILRFEKNTEREGFRMNLSVKANNTANQVGLSLSFEEGILLEMFFQRFGVNFFDREWEPAGGGETNETTTPAPARTAKASSTKTTTKAKVTVPDGGDGDIPF